MKPQQPQPGHWRLQKPSECMRSQVWYQKKGENTTQFTGASGTEIHQHVPHKNIWKLKTKTPFEYLQNKQNCFFQTHAHNPNSAFFLQKTSLLPLVESSRFLVRHVAPQVLRSKVPFCGHVLGDVARGAVLLRGDGATGFRGGGGAVLVGRCSRGQSPTAIKWPFKNNKWGNCMGCFISQIRGVYISP